MIKILFVCHGNILKSPEKACKINDFGTGIMDKKYQIR